MNEDNVMMIDTDSDTATESDTGLDTTMDDVNTTSEIDTSSDTSDTDTLNSTSDTEDTTLETATETSDDTASGTEDTTLETDTETGDTATETEDSDTDTETSEDTTSQTDTAVSDDTATDTETGDTATETEDSDTGEDTTVSDDSQISEDTATEEMTSQTDTETGDTATDADSEMSMGGSESSGDFGDSNDFVIDGLLDLTDVSDTSVPVRFTIERDASFDNTLGFYEIVSNDGSVEDPLSGQVIAPGQEGYQQAALANRLDLGLSTPDGQVTDVTTEIDGGSLYASYLVVDGEVGDVTDEATDNDPQVFFSPRTANPDNFNYIRSIGDNQIGYEDILGGGDEDFNDLIVEYEFV